MVLIATAQSTMSADVRANSHSIRALMIRARQRGARIVHFPEGALSGYSKSEVPDWTAFNWAVIREELESIAACAGELGLWTVVGCAHQLSNPHRPHNS